MSIAQTIKSTDVAVFNNGLTINPDVNVTFRAKKHSAVSGDITPATIAYPATDSSSVGFKRGTHDTTPPYIIADNTAWSSFSSGSPASDSDAFVGGDDSGYIFGVLLAGALRIQSSKFDANGVFAHGVPLSADANGSIIVGVTYKNNIIGFAEGKGQLPVAKGYPAQTPTVLKFTAHWMPRIPSGRIAQLDA